MTKKRLITIFIFLFFIIKIVLNLLSNLLISFIQPNFEQYLQEIQPLNGGQFIENPVLQVLSFTIVASFISPILEEFVYRSWITKKVTFLKSVFFIMFVFILGQFLIGLTPLYRPIVNLFTNLLSHYLSFFTNIYPPITFSIFNTSYMTNLALFLPFFVLIAYLVNYILLRTKSQSFISNLSLFLESFSPTLLLIFSSFIFYDSHGYNSIFVLLAGLTLGYITYNYSLKLSILLHILVNFTSSMRFYQNLQPVVAIVLNLTYFIVFTTILYLIYREIKLLKAESQLKIA